MKKALQTFSVYFLSALLVFSSSAWNLTVLQCQFSGLNHYHIGQDSDCCEGDDESKQETRFESSCCDVNSIHFGFELLQSKQCYSVFLLPFNDGLAAVNEGRRIEDEWIAVSSNSPPRSEPLHELYSVYLI
jgi:hypothetical protein